jgi:AcrR family transcriptional regulator
MPKTSVKKQRVPNSERRRNSTRLVLDAALSLFVTQGYDETSMDDIASAAGLTKGAVYFYFKDKLSLLGALLERTEAELFDPIFESGRAARGTAAERLNKITNWFSRVGAERPELPLLHVLVSLRMHQRDNVVANQVAKTYQRLHEEIESIIQDGRASGEFSTNTPATTQAAVYVALIDGLLLEWHRWGDTIDGRDLAASARELILHGLTAANTPT